MNSGVLLLADSPSAPMPDAPAVLDPGVLDVVSVFGIGKTGHESRASATPFASARCSAGVVYTFKLSVFEFCDASHGP